MTEVDEETREQFSRIIDAVLETRTAVDQKLDTFREEVRTTNDRLFTAMDGMSKELRDLRQEYHSLNAAVYRLEAEIDVRLKNLESRRDHDA